MEKEFAIGFSDEFNYCDNAVRFEISEDKRLGLFVEDCARALGVTQTKITKDGDSTTVRWERVYGDLVAIDRIPNTGDFRKLSKDEKKELRNTMKGMTITESDLYKWSFRVDSEQGRGFRDWLAEIVLPNLRQHGIYVTGMELMTPSEIELAVKDRTESYILRKFGIGVRRELTDAIKEYINPPIEDSAKVYGGFTNLIYNILFNMDANSYKESRGLRKKDSLRDDMKEKGESELLNRITKAEEFMCNLLSAGIVDKDMMRTMIKKWFENYKNK